MLIGNIAAVDCVNVIFNALKIYQITV